MSRIRKWHTLRFVILVTAAGTLAGGLVWLVIYDARWTPAINFDGPAVFALALAMIGGWLLSALIGLTLYLRGNESRRIVLAVTVIILCGLVAGLITGRILADYAMGHYYVPFCDQHPSMC
jgi:hypothetical protein